MKYFLFLLYFVRKMVEIVEKSLQTENGTIFYWINQQLVNSETALGFCHGLTADHGMFAKQMEAFSTTHRVIVWDIPLHGKSADYKYFSYSNVIADFKSILDKEGINRVILIGQSAGGYIAQAFINKYPDMVGGFVSIGSTPLGVSFYKSSELFWVKNFTAIAKLYPYPVYCKIAPKAVAKTEFAQKYMHETLIKLGKKGMLKASKAIYGEFLKFEEKVFFPCPVLLTYGEFDNIGFVKRYNKQWAALENFKLKVINNASHNANDDNAEEFNDLLRNFLESLEKQPKQNNRK